MIKVKKESLALKVIIFILIMLTETVFMKDSVKAETDDDYVYRSLDANIVYEGESIKHTDDEIYYINNKVDIILESNPLSIDELKEAGRDDIFEGKDAADLVYTMDEVNYVSYYDGDSFGDYSQMEGSNLSFIPDSEDEYTRNVVVFKKVESYKIYEKNGETKVICGVIEIVYETPVYQFILDKTLPAIALISPENPGTPDGEKNIIKNIDLLSFKISDRTGIKSIRITDNGNDVGNVTIPSDERIVEYDYDVSLGGNVTNAGNELIIYVTDLAGNEAVYKQAYELDIQRPRISFGGISDGNISPDEVNLSVDLSDNSSEVFVYYKCEYTNDKNETVCLENFTSCVNLGEAGDDGTVSKGALIRNYNDEGIYDITAFAYDSNGNYTDTIRISFGIDSKPPLALLENVTNNNVYREPVSVYATLQELYFMNTSVSMECSLVNSDVTEVVTLSPYDIKSKVNKNIYTFSRDGKYSIKMTATDNFGRKSYSECSFTIDTTPPKINVSDDLEIYNKPPEIMIEINDDLSEYVIDTMLIKYKAGDVYEQVDQSRIVSVGRNVSYKVPILEEGAYIIKINATDDAGNVSEKNLEFIVDETPPEIGYIKNVNEKYVSDFSLPKPFDIYIKDMTKVRYKTYLNSKEVSSCEITKDGKYIIQIVAEDEAGNVSEEKAAFIVDNTPPKIIVNGIGPDGNVNINDVIHLTLFDDMDYFKNVSVNGNDMNIPDSRKIGIPISKSGDYEVTISASDYAGNETVQTVKMSCALSANPFEKTISSSDIKSLTKNDDDFRETFLFNFSNPYFLIFSALVIFTGVIIGVITFVDIKKVKCDTRKDDDE